MGSDGFYGDRRPWASEPDFFEDDEDIYPEDPYESDDSEYGYYAGFEDDEYDSDYEDDCGYPYGLGGHGLRGGCMSDYR